MHFKQVEMTGFKSFADRTVVKLDTGITAIVGPNGCGKSNILDAVRWALGEQRPKELRGAAMQDVIFSGSDTRHATGMAEVTLTFDNSDSKLPIDFAEVEVTRRVYRSGESEYLINKAPCRLADIRELFMDTGVGTSAYSMVGQGRMDQILSSKPDERRAVFEEAAGVHKYKNRKRIALRRLDSANQNLLRLQDILAEVQRQMRSLKRQVNAAIRYRELSDQLREFEIRSAWLQFTKLTAEIEKLRAEFKEAQDAYEKISAETSTLEARSEELNLAKLELQRVLTARREGVHDINTNMEKIERQIALLKQQGEFAQRQREQSAQEREQFLERSKEIEGQIAQTRERVTALQDEIKGKQETLQEKAADHTATAEKTGEAEAQVQAIRDQITERSSRRAETLTEVETLGVRLSNIDSQIESILKRRDTDNARREELAQALQEARTQESELQSQLDQLTATRDQQAADRKEKIQKLREVEEAHQNHRERKSSLEARLASLRELRDTYEGFAAGVRAIMKAKTEELPEAEGVIGPIGDLISTGTEYERAIEAALGGSVNNVVVRDAEGAKGAIAYLKKNTAGRVTFLPLDIIRGGRGNEGGDIRQEPGVIGHALDYVNFDDNIRNAVEYTLHSTLLVETLDDAIRIARSGNRHPRLVTLDGEVVTGAGAVTGGRTKHQSRGLLGRSAEIAELEQKVAETERQRAELARERDGLQQAVQELDDALTKGEEEAAGVRKTLNEVAMAIARHSTELDRLGENLKVLGEEKEALSEQRQAIAKERDAALSRADTLQTDDEKLQQELSQAQEQASARREELSAKGNDLAVLRVTNAELTQRLEEAQRDLQREEREHQNALNEAERRQGLDAELEQNIARLDHEIQDNIERQKALTETKEEARAKVVEAENDYQKALEESEEVDKRLRALRDQSRDAQSRVHSVELSLRQDEERVNFFQERISDEYNVSLPSLLAEDVGTDDMEDKEREKLVHDVRQKLQKMGDVNLMAIEEYEELEKRNDFLAAQMSDLEQARDALLGVVERSDKKIREMFMETFEIVGNNFRETFRTLFGGGQARVYLLDEDDPLESGIEIEARPPGKKPQSISLLSGGERALTAVALLFAIFKAKPSPFCVLDEVDAPLDDANIGRFCEMLLEFSKMSQFVVITHNKQTMGKADVLYGVTQQERGVSELVSVRFEESTHSAA